MPKKPPTPTREKQLAGAAATARLAEKRRKDKEAGIDLTVDPTLRQAELVYASLIAMAREDSALFCEMILRDEESGDIIQNTPMHEEWHSKANSLNSYGTPQNCVIWAYPESGKSQQLAIGRTLWLLGRNPRYRIGILAAAERQAKKLIDSLRKHIESNEVLHQIFPDLCRGDLWQDNAISVKRTGIIKDPSVQVVTPGGKIQGARIDVLVIDDVLVEDNTRTAYLREKTATWIRTSVFSRMTKRGQVIMLANAFHPDDFAHILAKEPGYWSRKYPVLTPEGNSADPNRWPLTRIEQKRGDMGPTEFCRMYMCEPRNDGDARFKGEWIELCKAKGQGWPLFKDLKTFINFVGQEYWLAKGVYWGDLKQLNILNMPPGFLTVTGVDLGVSRKDAADPTVVSTILVWPDGTRHPVSIKRGKFSSPEIMQHVIDAHERFHSVVIVEDNGAQDYLIQGLRQDYPEYAKYIHGFRTGRNKHQAYGVESLGGEMSEGKWIIPCLEDIVDEAVKVWIQEMLYYSAKGHTGDVLMSMWMAREGARAFHRSDDTATGVEVSVVG